MDNVQRVLIVEDDMIISLVMEKMLTRLGHKILDKVVTGEEAIERAKELRPDIILMDIRLNGEIDGIDAMREIQKKSPIPVVYVTGNTDQQSRDRAEATDYVDFLIKPISQNELDRSLNKSFKLAC